MLNKLHFDFRNAKPAFLGVSYLKVDDRGSKPDVGREKPEPSFGDNIKQVERNVVKHVKANGACDGEILQCKTGHRLTGSAVQVDDGDSDRLPAVSAAATIQLHSSSVVLEPECAISSLGAEHMQSGDKLIPQCSVLENKTSPQVSASLSSSLVQANEPAELTHDWEQAKNPKWTENNLAENKTAATLPDSIDTEIKPLSVRANKIYSLRENVKLTLRSANCNTEESSNGFGHSESQIASASSSVALFDDDFDPMLKKKSKRKRKLQPAHSVKKSVGTKNTVKAPSIKTEAVCQQIKPELVRTPRKRRRAKCNSEDDVWPLRKKLILMPVNDKLSKSGVGRKRSSRIRKDSCAQKCKRKACKSASVEGIKTLPDLDVKLERIDTDVAEVLKISASSTQCDAADNNISSASVSGKWHIDITGADLVTDLDIDYGGVIQGSGTGKQKHLVSEKVCEQNVGHMAYAADADSYHPNISTSQETPPPSVASGSSSSSDDVDPSVNSDQEEESEFSDSRWLHFDTKLARYIDGRHFNRLVNGISVRVPATLSDETLSQIGQECLGLSQLTKREVKQLQDQVRLEEIYHRRATKSMLSVSAWNRRASSRSSGQRSVSHRTHRSKARSVATASSTGANESAQAFAVNQQGSSFAVDTELCQPAACLANDEEPCQSSYNDTAKSNNSEPDGMYESELSKGNIARTSTKAGHSLANIDGADQHESACVSVLVRIRRSIAAVKNKSQSSEQCGESPSVGLTLSQSKVDFDSAAKSDFILPCSLPRQKSGSNANSLHTRVTSLYPSDERLTTYSRQQSAANTVSTETNISYPGTVDTGDSEYIAAVALASLSVAAESPLRSSCVSAFKAHTKAAANHCQTDEESQSTQKDTTAKIIAKPTCDSSAEHPMEFSSSKTVTTLSSVKASDQSIESSGQHLKGGTKDRHGSADKRRGRAEKSVNGVSSESRRSHDRRSQSAEASHHVKRVTEGKDKSLTTYSTRSSKHNSSGYTTSSVDKRNPEVSRSAPDIVSRNDGHAASDKARHGKHRTGSRHHGGKNQESGHPEKKQSAGSNLEIGDSNASRLTEIDCSSDNISSSKFDVYAKRENVDVAITVASTVSSTASNSMLCTTSSNCVPVLSHTSLSISASQNALCSGKAVDYSDKTGEAKISMNSLDMPINLSTSLPAGKATTVHETSSDFDSNKMSKELPKVPGATNEQLIDADISGIMSGANVLITASVSDDKRLPDSCAVAKNNENSAHFEALNLTALADYSPQSPTSPFRELEEIRSPSPMPADLEKDDNVREIRSPSPCDIVSPLAVFRVVETSWDVKLSSPCEIQSPDVSEDEAEATVEEFNRHCNVCFQHGPVTIPLTAEETSGQTHDINTAV